MSFAKKIVSISRKIATRFKLEKLEKQGHRMSFNRYIYDVGTEFLKKKLSFESLKKRMNLKPNQLSEAESVASIVAQHTRREKYSYAHRYMYQCY